MKVLLFALPFEWISICTRKTVTLFFFHILVVVCSYMQKVRENTLGPNTAYVIHSIISLRGFS